MDTIVAVKERPILFSTPMVKAVDDDRKDITRRITGGLKKINERPDDWELYGSTSGETGMVFNYPKPGDWSACFRNKHNGEIIYIRSPYGGDRDHLWVRETWSKIHYEGVDEEPTYFFKALWTGELVKGIWKPSIHMPRAACRLRLEIVSIGVERLQDITEEDAKREGAPMYVPGHGVITQSDVNSDPGYLNFVNYRMGFEHLWQSINGAESWDANPWVWRIEFKKI